MSLSNFFRSWQRWVPLTVFAVTLSILFHRLLLGDVLYWGLPSLQFYPWREFAMSELAQGQLPLWNPYNGAGTPLLANYQSAILYPPHLLYFLWSGPQMMGWINILHLFWSGVGMWLLTGRLGSNTLGRGIAVLAYPLSNTIIARFGTIPMLETAAWFPFLILSVDLLLERATPFRFLCLTIVVAMQLLAGHAQWTFYNWVLSACYVLWHIGQQWRQNRPLPQVIQTILVISFAVLLGVGVSAVQLIPTAELQAQSQRASGVDPDFALNFSYPPLSLLTLFNPNFFGNPGNGTYAVNGAYFEVAAYVGFLPLILALLGTIHYVNQYRKQRKKFLRSSSVDTNNQPIQTLNGNTSLIPFFSIVTLGSFVLAFGRFGITPLLYHTVPTFNLFQAPARWLLLAVFSLTILAALVAPLWKPTRQTKRRARLAMVAAVSLIIVGTIGQVALAKTSALPLTIQLIQGVMTVGILLFFTALLFNVQPITDNPRWIAAVLIFVALDLLWANILNNPTTSASFYDKQSTAPTLSTRTFWPDAKDQQLPQTAFDQFLHLNDYRILDQQLSAYRQSQLPDLNLLDRQSSFNNNDPLRPEGVERYTRLLNQMLSPALIRAAAIGKVYPNAGMVQQGRAWIVSQVVLFKTLDEVEKYISDPSWNPDQIAAVIGNPQLPANPTRTTDKEAATVAITDETTQSITISVNTPQTTLLIIADTFYPGWKATVNDQPVEIYRTNLAFRGVVVPAGQSTVRMVYQPESWRIGLIVSLVSLAVMAVVFVSGLIRRKRV